MHSPYVHARMPVTRRSLRPGSGAVPWPVVLGTTPCRGASLWPPPPIAISSSDYSHYSIINQGQLVAAFQAWTLDKARNLADILVARGDLNAVQRGLLGGLA